MISCNYKSQTINITYFFERQTISSNIIEDEVKKLESSILRRKTLLANENYVKKAPSNIVELDRKKLAEEIERLAHLKEQMK